MQCELAIMSSVACLALRGGNDKSLTRPGRKKLQRPNSRFIEHTPHEAQYTSYPVVLTFASHSKTNLERCPSNQVSAAAMTSASDEKWRLFNFFQSKEQVVVRRGQIRRIGWVIKTLEAQVGQFLLGCKCPVSWGIVVQEQDQLDDIPAVFFLLNVLQLHQQR